jgi:hypothetical protein
VLFVVLWGVLAYAALVGVYLASIARSTGISRRRRIA